MSNYKAGSTEVTTLKY